MNVESPRMIRPPTRIHHVAAALRDVLHVDSPAIPLAWQRLLSRLEQRRLAR